MEKAKKYKLVRNIINATIISGIIACGANLIYTPKKDQIPYTSQDITNNTLFEEELNYIIEEQNITFKNKELEEIIKEQLKTDITKENLETITSLEITNKLNNPDLSDLKYLSNLLSLTIWDNDINLTDIKYNQNLLYLYIHNSNIKNTKDIPNSTESLYIEDSLCIDSEFIIPYYTKSIYLLTNVSNNIRLKNPKILESLTIVNDVVLDMNNLKECTNLNTLNIYLCSNIKNSNILRNLPSLKEVNLDEYASIWLDNKTLNKLPIDNIKKAEISALIEQLDNIALSLIQDKKLTQDEKITLISLYLLDNLEYDEKSVEEYETDKSGVTDYNVSPISTALETKQGVCVNYACLFQALANRLDIDSFQYFSKQHTWNGVKLDNEYMCYDIASLELGAILDLEEYEKLVMVENKTAADFIRMNDTENLYFYEFNLDEMTNIAYNTTYEPQVLKETILNIGYINENSLIKIIENNEIKLAKMNTSLKLSIMLLLLSIAQYIIYRKEQQHLQKSKPPVC